MAHIAREDLISHGVDAEIDIEATVVKSSYRLTEPTTDNRPSIVIALKEPSEWVAEPSSNTALATSTSNSAADGQ